MWIGSNPPPVPTMITSGSTMEILRVRICVLYARYVYGVGCINLLYFFPVFVGKVGYGGFFWGIFVEHVVEDGDAVCDLVE